MVQMQRICIVTLGYVRHVISCILGHRPSTSIDLLPSMYKMTELYAGSSKQSFVSELTDT